MYSFEKWYKSSFPLGWLEDNDNDTLELLFMVEKLTFVLKVFIFCLGKKKYCISSWKYDAEALENDFRLEGVNTRELDDRCDG